MVAMSEPLYIMWFRRDLRLADNPALRAAADGAARVLPVFILDDETAGPWRRGRASRWWLHQALAALDRSLDGRLVLLRGRAEEILPPLAAQIGAAGVFWNRCYEPWRIAQDRLLEAALQDAGLGAQSHNGSLLWEPWEVLKADGTAYRVFTPYYRRGCLRQEPPRPPLPVPENLTVASVEVPGALALDDLALQSSLGWQETLVPHWTVSEAGAQEHLAAFVGGGLTGYKEGRDFPARDHVSRLSPHLHCGTLSPHQVWHAAVQDGPGGDDVDHFCSELGWREFNYNLLYHFPTLPEENFQAKFDRFPWLWESPHLERWQRGRTGMPFVDAGLRELWQTGYMHNRVRMIVASYLVKNLLLHWRLGQDWFWDTLVDADLANNAAGWQWTAGSGADAAPYFRIFNPVTQGKRFDPEGRYARRWVPEIASLPDRWVHEPWATPAAVQKETGFRLGYDYPAPVVDLRVSRERALAAFGTLR